MVNEKLLREGLELLNIGAGGPQIDLIKRYLSEIELWNRRINLVRAEGDRLIIRHVFDCAAGVPSIREMNPSTVLDAGSGAGLPGIVLAIFLPEASYTLLEKSAKRVAFLRNCIAILGLKNCSVFEGELAAAKDLYDVVCCRAFLPLSGVFEGLAERLKAGGTMVLYKGRKEVILEEVNNVTDLATGRGYEHRLIELDVPFLAEERHLLQFRDTSR